MLAWAQTGAPGTTPRPSPFYEEARAALELEEEVLEEELFGPAEGLHSTFRIMRDELLDTVARVGGRLGEMRLDTYLDVDQAVARYLELIKVAALIERAREGQTLETALREVNEILAQCATPEQREIFEESALDYWLRDAGRDPAELPGSSNGSEPSLDPFIPRRGRGLMLSASDIDTYRICPLKYKFARVFRIPQEPTINQRFGIVMHQVLERFHTEGGGSLERLRSCSRSPGGAPASATPTTSCSSASARWRRSSATGARTTPPRPSRSGSSARSPSRSGRTCCAGGWTAWTATPTAPSS